jgi:8-oxo-dGTP pyrophosphatase MutT (NUDIX family)
MEFGAKITKSGAYIIDPVNKKILIIISIYNKIGIPKGAIENNEELYECAEREIKEETGLEIKIRDKQKTKTIFDGKYFFVFINNGSYKFIPNPNKLNKREIKESKWVDINFLEDNKQDCNITLKYHDNIINIPYLKHYKKPMNNKPMNNKPMNNKPVNNKPMNKNQQSFCNIL